MFPHFHRPWFQKYFPIRFLYRLFMKSCTNRSTTTLQTLISSFRKLLQGSEHPMKHCEQWSNLKRWYNIKQPTCIKFNAYEAYCKIVSRWMKIECSLLREYAVTVETLESIELCSKYETWNVSYYAFHGFHDNSRFSDWWISFKAIVFWQFDFF